MSSAFDSSGTSDEDGGKKPESGKSKDDAVPRQARATVEPTQDEVVEPQDLLSEIDEAKKKELATPTKSRSPSTQESGLSRDSPHKRLLSRLANAGQDYPDPEHIQQQMKEMWNGSWEGLDEDELKAREEKYNELDAQLAGATKRLVHERDTFAAASATYGQKADERGDDTRDLSKIVKRVEKKNLEQGKSKDNPFEPDGADETGFAPGQTLDKKVHDLLTECKASLATVEDEATRKTINNLTDMVSSVVHNDQRQQGTTRTRSKASQGG
jgi:hypothetical protein